MSIDRMRNMTAKVAIESGADYILFLDDDVIVPPNKGLQQLFDCEADVAAGKVCVRGYPFDYMSFTKNKKGGVTMDTKLPKTGIVDKEAVGFSFALLKTSFMRRMQEPYFVTGINHTEDVYYCLKAKQIDPKCKIRINCECECGHILWPEVIFEANRDSYAKYFKEINKIAAVKNGVKHVAKGGDRGADYLKKVKKVTDEAKSGMRLHKN